MYLGAIEDVAIAAAVAAANQALAVVDMDSDEQMESLRSLILAIPPSARGGTALNEFLVSYTGIRKGDMKAKAKAKMLARAAERMASGQGPPNVGGESSKIPLIVGGVGAAAILAFILWKRKRKR